MTHSLFRFSIILFCFLSSTLSFGGCFEGKAQLLSEVLYPSTVTNKPTTSTVGKKTIPSNQLVWAKAQGNLNIPFDRVFDKLKDHKMTAGEDISEFEVTVIKKDLIEDRFEHHDVHFIVKPFPFFTVEWDEAWNYDLQEGTKKDPIKILISYEKISGTTHIKHLCGNILISKVSDSVTDVFMYEEVNATQRNEKDTEKSLLKIFQNIGKN